MKHYLLLTFLLAFNLCFAQSQVDTLVNQLKQSDFGKIYKSQEGIINSQKEGIPKLIELLKDTSFIKLENTADLIYPGASQFYGHGWIVNYDIDWISSRSAWFLEEITFQNFGYRDLTITEDKLMNLYKQHYTTEYLKKGYHDIDFKNKTPREHLKMFRLMLADSVSKWWDKNKNTWTRFTALKSALASNDEQRQSLALHYLRFEKTLCDGLTSENYDAELKPLVQRIKESQNSQAEQAKYLLNDSEYYWLKIKTEKSGS